MYLRVKSIFNKASSIITMLSILIAGVVYFILGKASAGESDEGIPEIVDYNYHIRPILSDKCYKCHGPDAAKREAHLRLDTEEGAYKALEDDPGKHVIVKGDPIQSELYQRIIATDTSVLMPPPSSKLALTEREKKLIHKWIEQGAVYKKHWAFITPKAVPLPEIESDWIINEIDRFVLVKLNEKGLKPNEAEKKEILLKRVSIDLTGLPPSLEMQDRFLKDESPNAYEKIVDELMASKHYGEKRAVTWLDIARYADSHGYQDDGLRTMWPWRDWVIHAYNENYSYKKFVEWQLAGDLIPNASLEQMVASGFNRNHKITQEGGVIDEEYRLEYVTDRTNTFGKAFLALTFECSKCHDHKYDPITQKEYYGNFAFFNQVSEVGLYGDISIFSLADPPNMLITKKQVDSVLHFVNLKDSIPVPVMVMKDTMCPRVTYVLKRGAYDQKGDTVDYTTPKSILPFDSHKYPKNRLGLAQWLFDPSNPLTARVQANRLWQEIFGRGLVKTSGDFGMQGELPSHPELLDWLSLEFIKNNWDQKRLIKLMVMSATYRQSSVITKNKLEKDPENIYLSRHTRTRLTAEEQRDLVLASSQLLVPEIGGPSVKPYQPKGIWESSTSGRGQLARYVQDHGESLYRRTMYTFIKRTAPPPSLLVFDASNRDQCEVKRVRTNTPLQALVMLNDPQVLEASRVLSQHLISESNSNEVKINKAFRLIVCRNPTQEEMKILTDYHKKIHIEFSDDRKKAKQFSSAGEYPLNDKIDVVDQAALMQIIHTIFNLEESETKN
ncbi:MAG: PSD1 and planctomycete cytochrome C domain-containing protein [Chitinophagaceae bacterium]